MLDASAQIGSGKTTNWMRLFLLALGIALVCLSPAILPPLWGVFRTFYQLWIPGKYFPYIRLAIAVSIGVAFVKRPSKFGLLNVPQGFWTKSESAVESIVDRYLWRILCVSIVGMMALWLPHFVSWPWWADTDHFAIAAQAWDAGQLPYRDKLDFNFPGPMYLMWILGKLFGWGRTMPVMVIDALMLISFGFAMAAWSRERFGRRLPGLGAFTLFTCIYLSLNGSLVAQREWQAMWLVVLSLMAIESWPDRRQAMAIAAFLVALSFTFRPYPVLFLPAFIAALDERLRAPGESLKKTLSGVIWFGLVFGFMLALVFSPLWITGIADDFVRSLAFVTPGGPYNQNSPAGVLEKLLDEMKDWRVGWSLIVFTALAFASDNIRFRRTARTWLLVLISAIFYRPIGPVSHQYLTIPLELILLVGLTVQFAAIVKYPWTRPSSRLLALVVIFAWFFPGIPRFCDLKSTRDALAETIFGRRDGAVPIGIEGIFPIQADVPDDCNWESYLALLDYLRKTTSESTLVANTFRRHPYPAINGPIGRRSPYPFAGSLLWFRWIGGGREEEFCRALVENDDVVVAWSSTEKIGQDWARLPLLEATIRDNFQKIASFGVMEVWRKKPRGKGAEVVSPSDKGLETATAPLPETFSTKRPTP